jgi:hypothetical protein
LVHIGFYSDLHGVLCIVSAQRLSLTPMRTAIIRPERAEPAPPIRRTPASPHGSSDRIAADPSRRGLSAD